MYFLHPSIYYLDIRSLWMVFRRNMSRPIYWRRMLFMLVLIALFFVVAVLQIFFRILDEILFFGYRKRKIKAPVYIISQPRSGTTLLHQSLALDEENFFHVKMYHSFIVSITFYKLIALVGAIDNILFNPLGRLIKWISKLFFRFWEGIHNTGVTKPEEDEGIWFFMMNSPALSLITPFMDIFPDHYFTVDNMPERKRQKIKKYYYSCLQRICYLKSDDQALLMKSVMGSGRIKTILELMPDTRIVTIDRPLTQTVPSYVNMFSKSWTWHSRDMKDSDRLPYHKALARKAVEFEENLAKQTEYVSDDQLLRLSFNELIRDLDGCISTIYEKWGFALTSQAHIQISDHITRNKSSYKSSKKYTLMDFGITETDVSLRGAVSLDAKNQTI